MLLQGKGSIEEGGTVRLEIIRNSHDGTISWVGNIRLMLFDNCRPQVESSSSFENGSLSLHSRCLAISEDERKDSIGKFYV